MKSSIYIIFFVFKFILIVEVKYEEIEGSTSTVKMAITRQISEKARAYVSLRVYCIPILNIIYITFALNLM